MPRKYYVVTIRGERGPVDRDELKDLVRDGAARLTDRVRTATGRTLGSVAEALAQAKGAQTESERDLTPIPAGQRMSARRMVMRDPVRPGRIRQDRLTFTVIGSIAVVALGSVAWVTLRGPEPGPAGSGPTGSASAPDAPVASVPTATAAAAAPVPMAASPHPAPLAAAPAVAATPEASATEAVADQGTPLPAFGNAKPVPPPSLIGPADTEAAPVSVPDAPAAPAPVAAAAPAPPPTAPDGLMLWDGHALTGGHGWTWPLTPPNRIEAQDMVVHHGPHALRFHASGSRTINAGWQWIPTTTFVDFTHLHVLTVSLKIEGRAPPASVQLVLQGDGGHSKEIDLGALCPDFCDGQWHDIVVPVADLKQDDFDLASANQVNIETRGDGDLAFDLYVADLGYAPGSTP